jgi:hypothetical protein
MKSNLGEFINSYKKKNEYPRIRIDSIPIETESNCVIFAKIVYKAMKMANRIDKRNIAFLNRTFLMLSQRNSAKHKYSTNINRL